MTMMIDLDHVKGEALGKLLSDYQFEMLVRQRLRDELAAITCATEGTESHNYIILYANSEGAKWTVHGGRNYNSKHEAEGEVLSAVAEIVVKHEQMLGRTKLALLAGPEGPSAADIEPVIAAERGPNDDDESPF